MKMMALKSRLRSWAHTGQIDLGLISCTVAFPEGELSEKLANYNSPVPFSLAVFDEGDGISSPTASDESHITQPLCIWPCSSDSDRQTPPFLGGESHRLFIE